MVTGRLAGEAAAVTTIATVASAGATAGTNSTAVYMPWGCRAYGFVLDVTDANTGVDDTLDVQVQTLLDGTNYTAVASFTQVLGNGGAKRHVMKIDASLAQATFESSATLAAGSIRNWCGDAWRIHYVIVDPTGSDASFDFTVYGMPM